jgi:Domain of unknown function (DUF4136)
MMKTCIDNVCARYHFSISEGAHLGHFGLSQVIEENRMRKVAIAVLLASLALSGCVVPTGPVEVTRFNRAAEGVPYGTGSFAVRFVGNGDLGSDLMTTPYTVAVSREMQRIGYTEKTGSSDVVAEIDVSAQENLPPRQNPVSVGVGGSTGSYGSGVGLGIGINLGGGPKATRTTTLSVKIRRAGDNLVIWEGSAQQNASAKSPAAQPGIAASKLATALFQGFPGKSGETVQVK